MQPYGQDPNTSTFTPMYNMYNSNTTTTTTTNSDTNPVYFQGATHINGTSANLQDILFGDKNNLTTETNTQETIK